MKFNIFAALSLFMQFAFVTCLIWPCRKVMLVKKPPLKMINSANLRREIPGISNEVPPKIPNRTSFCVCPQCKKAYIVDFKSLSESGTLVRCSNCTKEWFLNAAKMGFTDEQNILFNLSDPLYPQKQDLFVTNIPFEYSSEDLGALFQEYGVLNAFVVLEKDKVSRGFGFVEVIKCKAFHIC